MKNIFAQPKLRGKYQSEIVETEITDWYSQHNLPRYISAPETKSYQGGHNLGKIDYTVRVCHVNAGKPTKTDLAWNILKYQLSDRASQQKHLENVRSNLEHRLQVAKTTGNNQLVNILQDEYRQLETSI
jgi:hypothetical protein